MGEFLHLHDVQELMQDLAFLAPKIIVRHEQYPLVIGDDLLCHRKHLARRVDCRTFLQQFIDHAPRRAMESCQALRSSCVTRD